MICALIAAAGKGTRMGGAENKIFLSVSGKPIIKKTVEAFLSHPRIDAVCIVCAECDREKIAQIIGKTEKEIFFASGGATRGESVLAGLKAAEGRFDKVLIHDAARPFIDEGTVDRVIDAIACGIGAVAGEKAIDTIKLCSADGTVEQTPERANVWHAQTPQGFMLDEILSAYRTAGTAFTDDAAVFAAAGGRVKMVEGSRGNKKVTTPEDLEKMFCVGCGLDVHRLCENRKLIIGGVEIPFEQGLLGHSDADVLLHAVCDALLSAAALGDIGKHFPDSDEKYKGISSMLLLKKVAELIGEAGFTCVNVSAVIAAQRPKMAPYIEQMNKNIADVLGIDACRVNVAATTTELLGFEGRGEGISARATVLLETRGQ